MLMIQGRDVCVSKWVGGLKAGCWHGPPLPYSLSFPLQIFRLTQRKTRWGCAKTHTGTDLRQKEDGRIEIKIKLDEAKCCQQFATWPLLCFPVVLSEPAAHIQLSCSELIMTPQDMLPSSLSVFTQMAKLIRDKQCYQAPLFSVLVQTSSSVRVGERETWGYEES